jgi:hypothetical protein
LYIEAGEKLAADEVGEAGGHSAGGTGNSGTSFELATLQAEAGVGTDSCWAGG